MSVGGAKMASLFFKPVTQGIEEEEVRLEQETLRREFEWLLDCEFNEKLKLIGKCMEECHQKLLAVLNPVHGSGGHKILLTHPQQGEPVTCVASVEGDKISNADITLKLPGKTTGSKPLRTSIKEHAAWRLKQIQDSVNHFEIAYQELQTILANKDCLSTPTLLSQAFGELYKALRSSEQVLVVPQLPSIAEIYSAERRSHFKPELPEDTIIHFHINSSKLVLTILSVNLTNKSQTSASSSGPSNPFQVDSTFEYGSNMYELTSKIQVQSPVPWLSAVLHLLQEAQEITQDFIDKVKMFGDTLILKSNGDNKH